MIEAEKIEPESKLFHLDNAFDSLRPCFRARERRQQQTDENANDRDDDQQLDQSKGPPQRVVLSKSRMRVHIGWAIRSAIS